MAESIVALKQAGAGAAPALTLMGITIQEIKIYTRPAHSGPGDCDVKARDAFHRPAIVEGASGGGVHIVTS